MWSNALYRELGEGNGEYHNVLNIVRLNKTIYSVMKQYTSSLFDML